MNSSLPHFNIAVEFRHWYEMASRAKTWNIRNSLSQDDVDSSFGEQVPFSKQSSTWSHTLQWKPDVIKIRTVQTNRKISPDENVHFVYFKLFRFSSFLNYGCYIFRPCQMIAPTVGLGFIYQFTRATSFISLEMTKFKNSLLMKIYND